MERLLELVPLIKTIVWPLVVIIVVVLFRKHLRSLFDRVQKARLPGGAEAIFRYGDASADVRSVTSKPQPPKSTSPEIRRSKQDEIKWKNVANIFWLGHDIMFTMDVALRAGSKSNILFGLRQSLHHARELGMQGHKVESLLADTLKEVESSLPDSLDNVHRNNLAKGLAHIRDTFGNIVNSAQGDFRPWATTK